MIKPNHPPFATGTKYCQLATTYLPRLLLLLTLELAASVVGVSMAAEEDALERLPELGTEYRVDDRIQRRVEVAQPQEEREERVANLAALAQRHQQGGDEERQPAHDKGPRDDGQRFGRLAFPLRLERLFAFRHLRLGLRLRTGRDDRAVLHGGGHLTRRGRQLMVLVLVQLLQLGLVDQLDQVMWLLLLRRCRGNRQILVAADAIHRHRIPILVVVVGASLQRLVDYKMGHGGDLSATSSTGGGLSRRWWWWV